MEITVLLPHHWAAVKKIYEEGIATGNATFQTTAPSWQEWDAAHVKNSRLVAIENLTVLGWAALTPVLLFFTLFHLHSVFLELLFLFCMKAAQWELVFRFLL